MIRGRAVHDLQWTAHGFRTASARMAMLFEILKYWARRRLDMRAVGGKADRREVEDRALGNGVSGMGQMEGDTILVSGGIS
jgi:hypothetical protein